MTKRDLDYAVDVIENSAFPAATRAKVELTKDYTPLSEEKPDIACVLSWLSIGIMLGLILAGAIFLATF